MYSDIFCGPLYVFYLSCEEDVLVSTSLPSIKKMVKLVCALCSSVVGFVNVNFLYFLLKKKHFLRFYSSLERFLNLNVNVFCEVKLFIFYCILKFEIKALIHFLSY